MQQDA
jgi:hypothetical protein